MEANGYAARIAGLERIDQERARELSRQRDRVTTLEVGQGIQDTQIKATGDDVGDLQKRMDRMARAFWAAAGTFSALTLTGLGIIVTLVTGG